MKEGANKNIILVGFTSSGKSTIGKYLSQRLLCDFFDIDHMVSKRIGFHQDTFIDANGWEKFREEEYRTILELIPKSNSVIATGGGTLLGEKSRSWLKENGIWVYLDAPIQELYGRIQERGDRPLAKSWSSDTVQEKLAERLPYYEQAQLRVKASGPINNIAEDVFRVVKEKVLEVPFEFWFRKEYEPLIQNKKLTSFVRPGNRLAPAPKGTSVGAMVRIRILERRSTPTTLPELTGFTATATVQRAEVKTIAGLLPKDLEGAGPDANSQELVQSQLQVIYGRKFLPDEVITVFKVGY